jgi:hypothetical protein
VRLLDFFSAGMKSVHWSERSKQIFVRSFALIGRVGRLVTPEDKMTWQNYYCGIILFGIFRHFLVLKQSITIAWYLIYYRWANIARRGYNLLQIVFFEKAICQPFQREEKISFFYIKWAQLNRKR